MVWKHLIMFSSKLQKWKLWNGVLIELWATWNPLKRDKNKILSSSQFSYESKIALKKGYLSKTIQNKSFKN